MSLLFSPPLARELRPENRKYVTHVVNSGVEIEVHDLSGSVYAVWLEKRSFYGRLLSECAFLLN